MSADSDHGLVTRRSAAGFVMAFAVGVSDVLLFRLLGVELLYDGRDVTVWIVLFFAVSFGLLGGAIGRILDQRERIAAQLDELRDARRRVVEQEKLAAVGRLASSVAHEVRNPLGVIRSSASLIEEDLEEGGDGARAVRFIVEEVDRLDGFVRRVLGFTRPLSPELRSASIEVVVESAAATLEGVEIEIEEPGATLEVDEGLVVQALRNLLANACEAGERVRLVARAEGAVWRFVVSDDGPGVDDGDRARLFEPFFTTRASGSGLGLAMVRKIAEIHGGEVVYRSGRGLGPGGRGACFEVEIPGRAERSELR